MQRFVIVFALPVLMIAGCYGSPMPTSDANSGTPPPIQHSARDGNGVRNVDLPSTYAERNSTTVSETGGSTIAGQTEGNPSQTPNNSGGVGIFATGKEQLRRHEVKLKNESNRAISNRDLDSFEMPRLDGA